MSERYTPSTSTSGSSGPEPVGSFVSRLKTRLESEFRSVYLEGELSNISRPTSGHLYFTLKDADGQMRCVMWKSNVEALRFRPADGLAVRIRGGVSVYAQRGNVQISVRSMVPAGEGALQRAFAELGRRLSAEGLFRPERKRPLPRYPERVGVVTSRSGAAVRDILSVLKRRYPIAHVIVCPVVVQGEEASRQIVEAIAAFNRLPLTHPQRPDVLIVARGGGSLEDLWAFNEEPTVRAVHNSGIPIVSGVGHETDTTLTDLVADKRAPTPSGAAEEAVPDQEALLRHLQSTGGRHRAQLEHRLRRARDLVARAAAVRQYGHPSVRLASARESLEIATGRLSQAANRRVQHVKVIVDAHMQKWRMVNPLRPLDKGFALVQSAGRRIDSAAQLPAGEPFMVTFRDGMVEAESKRNAPSASPLTSPDRDQGSL
ncbi:MAG: exodeoxyribonuclease VII large subunit [Rhodothermales bacterium]|nr:exodeoxyribonuclease VII large subunit [Rhodothermales bacterium]